MIPYQVRKTILFNAVEWSDNPAGFRGVDGELNAVKYSGLARVYVCVPSEQILGNETLRETCIVACEAKKLHVFSPKSILSLNSLASVVAKDKRFSVVISLQS